MTPRVAVVGGGLAGLAAAGRLRMLGIDATVFERDPDVGGVVRTSVRDGWTVDAGPCLAAEPDPAVRALLDNAGIGARTIRARDAARHRYIVLDGAPVPLPHTTSEFTASPLLSIAGRLRLLKERFIAAEQEIAEESVDAFARRRFGDEMADRMFDPLLASTCAGDPREVLARYAFPAAVGHERRAGSGLQGNARARMEARRRARGAPAGSWSCADGMGDVPHALAAWIGDVRTGAAVDAVRATGDAMEVVTGGTSAIFDGVVVAVPAPALSRLALDVPEGERIAGAGETPCRSIASVALGYRREDVRHPLDAARLLVPTKERLSLLSAVFPSSLFDGRAPDGHALVTGYVGGARRPDMNDLSDDALVALVHRELAALLGIVGDPVFATVTTWRDALPQAVAGHARRIASADIVETAAGPLAFTGGWRDGLSVGEVLLGGVRAAERLAARQGWLGFPSHD